MFVTGPDVVKVRPFATFSFLFFFSGYVLTVYVRVGIKGEDLNVLLMETCTRILQSAQ